MHPLEDEPFGTLYFTGKDGEMVPFTGLETVTEQDITETPESLEKMAVMQIPLTQQVEFVANVKPGKGWHGLWDLLCGRQTKAAMRYRRHIIRKMEKERRRRLKHG